MLNRANALRVPTNTYARAQLVRLTREEHFQHMVLKCSPLAHIPIDSFEHFGSFLAARDAVRRAAPKAAELQRLERAQAAGKNGRGRLLVFLDRVTDPQNFGALLRSAFFFVD